MLHRAGSSAALCTHCRAELLLSIATGALEAKLRTDRQLKTKTQHVSLHHRYFKPWLCVRYAGRLEEAPSPTTPARLSRNPIKNLLLRSYQLQLLLMRAEDMLGS